MRGRSIRDSLARNLIKGAPSKKGAFLHVEKKKKILRRRASLCLFNAKKVGVERES